jgi:putative methyltransferase (TIGR04325 family)
MTTQSKVYSGNTLPLRPSVKQAAKTMLEALPIIGDFVHAHYVFPRKETACRGVYATFEEARDAVDRGTTTDYDACNRARSVQQDIDRVYRADYEDYPVLLWLKDLVHPDTSIIDLGGSTGGTFFAFDAALRFPDSMMWTVSELPAAVEKGRLVAAKRSEPRLSFVTDPTSVRKPTIFLSIGTLQYIPRRLSTLLGDLTAPPDDVIVHKMPVTDGPAYWTIQNLGVAKVPYFIENPESLVTSMESIGYELRERCNTLRSIRIPFHPEHDVNHYSGFLFKRKGKVT